MPTPWPPLSYGPWSATRDTLHAHTQVDHERAAFFAFAYPTPGGFADASLTPRRWRPPQRCSASDQVTGSCRLDPQRSTMTSNPP